MNPERRTFLQATAGSLATTSFVSTQATAAARGDRTPRITREANVRAWPGPFKAIAFDAFPIFDPRPVAARAEALYPGHGAALMTAWRTRQFEYQWLRALAGKHEDFVHNTRAGLRFALRQLRLDEDPAQIDGLMAVWSSLPVWPDVPAAVATLREAGLRLVFLSNMTHEMLVAGLRDNALEGSFEPPISTDRIRSCKPDPRAYQFASHMLALAPQEILFVAFAGWDAVGAKWFGYPTFWLNRMESPDEELGSPPDGRGKTMDDLTRFVLAPKP